MTDPAVAWARLRHAYVTVENAVDAALQPYKLAPTDYEILAALGRSKGHEMRPGDIAEAVDLSKSGITRALDRVERAGWVVRELIYRGDGRGRTVVLTDAGKALVARAYPAYTAALRRSLPAPDITLCPSCGSLHCAQTWGLDWPCRDERTVHYLGGKVAEATRNTQAAGAAG